MLEIAFYIMAMALISWIIAIIITLVAYERNKK